MQAPCAATSSPVQLCVLQAHGLLQAVIKLQPEQERPLLIHVVERPPTRTIPSSEVCRDRGLATASLSAGMQDSHDTQLQAHVHQIRTVPSNQEHHVDQKRDSKHLRTPHPEPFGCRQPRFILLLLRLLLLLITTTTTTTTNYYDDDDYYHSCFCCCHCYSPYHSTIVSFTGTLEFRKVAMTTHHPQQRNARRAVA